MLFQTFYLGIIMCVILIKAVLYPGGGSKIKYTKVGILPSNKFSKNSIFHTALIHSIYLNLARVLSRYK